MKKNRMNYDRIQRKTRNIFAYIPLFLQYDFKKSRRVIYKGEQS